MSVTFPYQPGAGSEDERGPGEMYRDEAGSTWVVLADSSVVQVGGGGSQPVALSLVVPALPLETDAPTTFVGLAITVPSAAGWIGESLVFVGEQSANGAVIAQGVVDTSDPPNFTDGVVTFTYADEGPFIYNVAEGVAKLQGVGVEQVITQSGPPDPIGTWVAPMVLDTTAVTGGLYAWGNNGEYIQVAPALS